MIGIPDLRVALLDLLYATRDADLKLILGGGYGLYLRQEHVRASGVRTLLAEWPEARSTNDLDLFLRPELLIDSRKVKPLAEALKNLGYKVVEGAEKYQFVIAGPSGGRAGSLRVDLLTGPQSCFHGTGVHADERRVRPKPSVGLHAHPVDEALTLEEGLMPVTIDGKTSHGDLHHAEIYLPHAFTFAMMKLFAFRDRFSDQDKDFGTYHALDIYTIFATTSEPEWEMALKWSEQRRSDAMVIEAAEIVHRYFTSQTSAGMLRLQESPYARPELQLDDFVSALHELFPSVSAG